MLDAVLHISDLIRKYHKDDLSPAELAELASWRSSDPENEALFKELTDPYSFRQEMKRLYEFEQNADAVLQRILNSHPKKRISRIGWRKMIAVAAAVVLIAGGIYLWNAIQKRNVNDKSFFPSITQMRDHNKALLTLYNGTSIQLQQADSGIITQLANMRVTKPRSGELVYETFGGAATSKINTLETPAGGQYSITLEDGTRVLLNTLSILKFPGKFASNERRVWLSGEAYFQVKKNNSQPFFVMTDGQEIEVTGTKFVVSAYNDEQYAITTVEEGSVKVTAVNHQTVIELKHGQSTVFNDSSRQLKLSKNAHLNAALAFVKGGIMETDEALITNSATLRCVMKQISRWYDVKVDYEDGFNPDDILVSGMFFEKKQTLPEIINVLNDLNISVRTEQKRLIVNRLR